MATTLVVREVFVVTSRDMKRTATLLGALLSISMMEIGVTMVTYSDDLEEDDLEEAVERALIPRSTEGRDRVERVAQDWTRHFLTPAFHLPSMVRFVASPRRDATDCDHMRMCYAAEGGIVTVAQTSCLFSIQLEVDRWGDVGRPEIGELQRLARGLLNGADEIELTIGDRAVAYAHGGANLPERAQANAPWVAGLQWRQDGDRVVFWWVKYEKDSERRRNASLRDNSRGFSPPIKE